MPDVRRREAASSAFSLIYLAMAGCVSFGQGTEQETTTTESQEHYDCKDLDERTPSIGVRNFLHEKVTIEVSLRDPEGGEILREDVTVAGAENENVDKINLPATEKGTYSITATSEEESETFEWYVSDHCDSVQVRILEEGVKISKYGRD